MKNIDMSDAQRKAAAELARELPHAAKIKKLREELRPLSEKGLFDAGYTDPETGLVFSVRVTRTLFVNAA